jgi:hypothetical protein
MAYGEGTDSSLSWTTLTRLNTGAAEKLRCIGVKDGNAAVRLTQSIEYNA